MADAVKLTKKRHQQWKEAGRPRGDNLFFTKKVEASRRVRRVTR